MNGFIGRSVIRSIIFSVGLILFCAAAWAQNVPPALFVKDGERSVALEVTAVSVDTRIYGSLAQTSMTLTFYNPGTRAVAGDLYFPLPEGATVSGYALDIKGVMIDGVTVEKDRGRQVFEKIVRQGLDPGLVEWVKGDNFKTRIFPIPAKGTRTVRVKYIASCPEKAQKRYYYLPLKFKGRVKDFSIRVQVVKPVSAPVVEQGAPAGFHFAAWEDGFTARAELKNADLSRDLVVAVPTVNEPPVQVEKSADGNIYFTINDTVNPGRTDQPPVSPRTISLYWDASMSRATADHEREFDLLNNFFSLHKKARITVELVVFRNTAEKAGRFVISNGGIGELISALRKIEYDGGTQMGGLPPASPGSDYALLFTDGISNFGKEDPPPLNVPLYIFSDQAGTNHSFLRYLALQNKGEYFNLNNMENDAVIGRIGRTAFGFLGIKTDADQVTAVFPSLPQPVDTRFSLTGILKQKSARIVLQYGMGGKVTREQVYTISAEGAVSGELLRLNWAQKKLSELVIFPERNMEEIVKLGKEYGLVTPGTSLIVLESLEQYVEHRIAPPQSLPDMREEYFEAIARLDREIEHKKHDKLERVAALWQERIKWWNTTFKYPKDYKYDTGRDKTTEPRGMLNSTGGEPPTERPAPGDLDLGEREEELALTPEVEKKEIGTGANENTAEQPAITVQGWDPDTPYLNALKKAQKNELYGVYLGFKKEYGGSPAFYLDCGDYFHKQGLPELGLRIWSNIAEMELENAALLRILAHRLAQEKELELAASLFETVLKLRPEEPQSYRDLALVLGDMGRYERAIDLLYQVVLGEWDRFDEIELIALMELNAMVPKARAAGVKKFGVDPRLLKLLDVDVRIIMTWDADLTDMDLWVTEPSGEKAYYGNRSTTIGGNFSRDFTQGYGPEEYLIRKAMKGTYKIEANYFSNRAPSLSGTVTIQVDIFTNYGRPNQEHKAITIRLRDNKETILIGEISF
jgi:Ca-activated chloride channel family protein